MDWAACRCQRQASRNPATGVISECYPPSPPLSRRSCGGRRYDVLDGHGSSSARRSQPRPPKTSPRLGPWETGRTWTRPHRRLFDGRRLLRGALHTGPTTPLVLFSCVGVFPPPSPTWTPYNTNVLRSTHTLDLDNYMPRQSPTDPSGISFASTNRGQRPSGPSLVFR